MATSITRMEFPGHKNLWRMPSQQKYRCTGKKQVSATKFEPRNFRFSQICTRCPESIGISGADSGVGTYHMEVVPVDGVVRGI